MEKITELSIITFLEDLVGHRFTRQQLQDRLDSFFRCSIEFEDITYYDDDLPSDWNFIFNYSKRGIFVDVDLYYLKSRNGNQFYITEVAYHFE